MRDTLLRVLLTVCLLPSLACVGSAAPLDGSAWKMRFRSARAWLHVWKGDLMRFDSGKFADTECGSYGFSESAYRVQQRDGRAVWRATRYNADGERVDWEGVVQGNTMTGTFTWSRPDGRARTYSFKARRKDARAASKG